MNEKSIDTPATPETDRIRSLYERLEATSARVRERLGRPLTFAEKILFAHLHDPHGDVPSQGSGPARFDVDRVAMQDVTGQMAMLQFILTGCDSSAVPATIHCDHLIRAEHGAADDLLRAHTDHGEIYRFLADAAARYGIGLWKPGSGIIHQVVLEQYAFPGGLLLGSDSHTPNAGGLGMLAIGVGGADIAYVMAGQPWSMSAGMPRRIGVRLVGALRGWTSGKDVIVKLAGILTTRGGGSPPDPQVLRPGRRASERPRSAPSPTWAPRSVPRLPCFRSTTRWPATCATGREPWAALAEGAAEALRCDAEVLDAPEAFFDRVIEIDLDALEPQLAGARTPDLVRPLSEMREDVRAHDYPAEIRSALIGSCTNSSYEDLGKAAHVARQAARAGLPLATPLLVTPGSERILETVRREGQLGALRDAGARVLANACGPCIGQWTRAGDDASGPNTIVTTYNRNFRRRNDGNADTHTFIGSPEIVTALAFAGRLDFDPTRDSLTTPDGLVFRFAPPEADELPPGGFEPESQGYVAPVAPEQRPEAVRVAPESERVALLAPFDPWDGRDFVRLPLLVKAKGKCTTDQISPAGPWLRYRGHLDRISDNLYAGVVSAFTGEEGRSRGRPLHEVARAHVATGQRWVMVGAENVGEGSSREHAAMSPRHLGCAAVLARGFARIHEANLKRQGVLALTFRDGADYDAIGEDDLVSLQGLAALAPGRPIRVRLDRPDGSHRELDCPHTLTAREIEWFRAGSAINWIRAQRG